MFDNQTPGVGIVISTSAILLLLYYLVTLVCYHSQYKLPPGPKPWPLIGNAWGLIGQRNLHEYFLQLTKKYGPIFSFKIGNVPHVIVNNADLAQEMYVTKMAQFVDRPLPLTVSKLAGEGRDLISQSFTPLLKIHRKITKLGIRTHVDINEDLERHVYEQCQPAFQELTKFAKEKKVFSPRYLVVKTVYKLYLKLFLNKDFAYDDPEFWYLASLSIEFVDRMGVGFLADLAPSIFGWLPEFGSRKIAMKNHEIFKAFIRKHVLEIEENLKTNPDMKGGCAQFLRARQEAVSKDPELDLTVEDIVVTVVEMFIGGADSIVNIFEWLFLEMANNPDKQEKMFEEIQRVLGDRPVTVNDRAKMTYCECVISEVLRTGLTVPINLRGSVVADTELAGYDIPKNTPVFINHHAMHVDEEFWGKDVGEFKPERFIGPDGEKIPRPKNLMPFGAGGRACPGENLARNSLFLLFVAFIQRFKICKPPGVEKVKSEYYGGLLVFNTIFHVVAEERK